jgi:large subunit ribosomal protein L13
MQTISESTTTIDADGLVLGRMASKIAGRLLKGERIIIVNAEKAVLSGRKKSRVIEGHKFLEVGSPGRGPLHQRRPDRIVRRTIRGMLPFKQPKGVHAYKRLAVFIGVPDELRNQKMETLEEAQAKRLTCPYFTVGEYAKEIGWNAGE